MARAKAQGQLNVLRLLPGLDQVKTIGLAKVTQRLSNGDGSRLISEERPSPMCAEADVIMKLKSP